MSNKDKSIAEGLYGECAYCVCLQCKNKCFDCCDVCKLKGIKIPSDYCERDN